jgi:long-chain acyl-CoA synthetase
MTAVLLLGIYNGFELILHPRLDLLALLKDIHRKKPTLMPGVPTLFSAICNHRHVKRYKLSSLKACISGGAPLPLEVKTRFEEISHSHLFEGYGLTEASPVACVNPIGEHSKDRSIGLPLPGTVIEIRSTEGRHPLVEKGKIGEICITGPQVMQGYLNHEEETKKTLISGRLHTGDLGYIDSEGYVFVVDRLKEVIITSGFNVYPREIEELLYQHPLITEAAVIGIEDEHRGQAIKAFIVPRLGETLTEDEVRRYLRGKLTKYKIPSIIEFPSDLPKTLIGKIEKKKLS